MFVIYNELKAHNVLAPMGRGGSRGERRLSSASSGRATPTLQSEHSTSPGPGPADNGGPSHGGGGGGYRRDFSPSPGLPPHHPSTNGNVPHHRSSLHRRASNATDISEITSDGRRDSVTSEDMERAMPGVDAAPPPRLRGTPSPRLMARRCSNGTDISELTSDYLADGSEGVLSDGSSPTSPPSPAAQMRAAAARAPPAPQQQGASNLQSRRASVATTATDISGVTSDGRRESLCSDDLRDLGGIKEDSSSSGTAAHPVQEAVSATEASPETLASSETEFRALSLVDKARKGAGLGDDDATANTDGDDAAEVAV